MLETDLKEVSQNTLTEAIFGSSKASSSASASVYSSSKSVRSKNKSSISVSIQSDMSKEKSDLSDLLAACEASKLELEQTVSDLNQEIEKYKQNDENLSNDYSILNKNYNKLFEDFEALENTLKNKEEQLSNAWESSSHVQINFEADLKEKNSEIEKLKQRVDKFVKQRMLDLKKTRDVCEENENLKKQNEWALRENERLKAAGVSGRGVKNSDLVEENRKLKLELKDQEILLNSVLEERGLKGDEGWQYT